MRFEITAYRHDEGVAALRVEAASAEEARENISGRGYEVVSVRQIGQWVLFQRKRGGFDLLLFSQELRSLLDAGLSLIESLSALSRKETTGEKRRVIEALIRGLREGRSLSDVLRESPATFPPLYLALTAASEQTGDLGGALGRFIDYRGRMDTIRKRVVGAAIYPALLLAVGGLVILFLMTYVVPRFSRVYEEFGANLPFMSRLLLQWGALITNHGQTILMALAVIIVAAVALLRRQKLKPGAVLRRLLNWKALAGLRTRVQAYALARFYRTLGLLLHGGIPAVTALGMARELLDEGMQASLDRAMTEVRRGVALSEAMERAHLAPPVASELLRVGEKTGDMGAKLIHIADFYDEETVRWAEWFTRLFEPLLMLTMGLFIAFIVVLLYMPIFELAGSVQ